MGPTLTQSGISPRLVLVEADTLSPLAVQAATHAAIRVGVHPTEVVPVTNEPKVQALQVIMGHKGIDLTKPLQCHRAAKHALQTSNVFKDITKSIYDSSSLRTASCTLSYEIRHNEVC